MPKEEPIELIFAVESHTKNKTRFQEMEPTDGKSPPKPTPRDKAVLEKLYISKKLLAKRGNPETARVTIDFP